MSSGGVMEQFKKTFQENHQPLMNNMKKEMQSMSREQSKDKLLRASNGFEQKRTTTNASLNNTAKNTATRNHNGQNKFFVYVNQSADENMNPSTTQNLANEMKNSLPFKQSLNTSNQLISSLQIQSRQAANPLNQSNNSNNLVLRKIDINGRTSNNQGLPLNTQISNLNDQRIKQLLQQQQFDSDRNQLDNHNNIRNYPYQINQGFEYSETHGSNSTTTLTYQNSSCFNNANFLSYGMKYIRQNQQRGQEHIVRQRNDNNQNDRSPRLLHPSLAMQSSQNNQQSSNNNNNRSFQKRSIPNDSLNGISKSTFNNNYNFSSNPNESGELGTEQESIGNINNLNQDSSHQRLSQLGRKITKNLLSSNKIKNNTSKQVEDNSNSNSNSSSSGSLNELEAISFGAQQQATTSRNDRTFEDEFDELNEAKNYDNSNNNQQAYSRDDYDDEDRQDEERQKRQIHQKDNHSANINNMQTWFEQEHNNTDGQESKSLRMLENSTERFAEDNNNKKQNNNSHNNLRSTSLTESSTSKFNNNSSPMDGLKQENTQLKKIVFQMKLDMKSQLEEGLVAQRSQMQAITQEYVQFIEKIVSDKKELTKRCEQLILDNSSVVKGNEVEDLKAEIVEHINRENETSKENDQLQQQIIAERNILNNKIETLNQQVIGLSKEKQQIKEEKESEQQVFKQQIEGLAQENAVLKEKNAELESKYVKLSQEIEIVNDNNNKSHRCFEEQINELTDMHQQRIQQYESITRQLNDEIARQKQQHVFDKEKLEEELEECQRQIEISRSRVEKLEAEIVEETRLRKVNDEICIELREQVVRLEKELEEANKQQQEGEEAMKEVEQKGFQTETEGDRKDRYLSQKQNYQSNSSQYDTNNNNNNNNTSHISNSNINKADELEILISQIDDERKQACEMVRKMKEAHELLRNKYEDEVKILKERHTAEFSEYEENIRSSLQKKDQSISKLHLVIDSLKGLLAANQIE